MKNTILFISFSCLFFVAFGQGGYLGSKNGIEFEIYGTPSFKKSLSLNNSGTVTKTTNKISYMSYAVSLSRVIDKNIEFNIKYRYTNGKVPFHQSTYLVPDTNYTNNNPQDVSYKVLNFLEDAGTKLHFLTFGFKYYRFGSIAPLGKYIGLEFEYGTGTLKADKDIYVGKGNIATINNFLIVKKDILEIDTIHPPGDIKGKINSLNFLIGRSYPLTDFLLLTVGMKFPILSLVSYSGYIDLGQGAQKYEPFNYSTQSNFEQIIRLGLGKYTRATFNFGIKLMF